MRSRSVLLFTALAALTLFLFLLDLAVGAVAVPLGDVWAALTGGDCPRATAKIILNIRLIKAVVALLAGTVTAFCGPIGFIGLAMPHVTRMLFRNRDHRVLVPGTVLSGASVLLLCDLVSKLFTLPINAITALLGIPIVVWVVLRNKSVTA